MSVLENDYHDETLNESETRDRQQIVSNTSLIKIEEDLHTSQSVKNNFNSQQADAEKYPEKHTRLCGYLNRLTNRGILKSVKKRWFVFSEHNCKLYYYRSPHDQVPLGEIDISQASFSFDASNPGKATLFTISIPGKDFVLEANNRQTCLFWLQELQKHRRTYSFLRTQQISEKSISSIKPVYPQSGLLAQSILSTDIQAEEPPLIAPVECPNDAVGDACAEVSHTPLSLAQQKFNVLCSQVVNTVIHHDKLHSNASSPGSENESLTQEKRLSSQSVSSSSYFYDESLMESAKDSSSNVKTAKSFRMKFSSSFRKSHFASEEDGNKSPKMTSKGSKDGCTKCHEVEEKLTACKDEVSVLRDELTACRDIISVLQKQLNVNFKENETLLQLSEVKDSTEYLKILKSKDIQVINLSHDIQEQKKEIESLQKHISSMKHEIVDLEQKNELLVELLQQKDKTIISLTNEVFDLETEKRDQELQIKSNENSASNADSKSLDYFSALDDTEKLRDAVQAFELQNKFLNKEILELNQLRRESEKREQLLYIKCSEWEARSYQIQSKLFYLLNELAKPESGNKSHEVISRLLQEAMNDENVSSELSIPSWKSERMYDELGFNWRWGKEDLSTKAANLKHISEDITNKSKDVEIMSWHVKWDNFIVALGTKELQPSPELKVLIRQGIPNEHRGRIWKGCILMRVKSHKMCLGPNYYRNLLSSEEFTSRVDPSSKQIELDLLRTLPNNCHYESLDSDGIIKLRRVLLAYSRHDPSVGYCQGLNRLAAIALLFMDEEDAFWCLVAIIKYIMPEDYYSRTLIASQVDQRVLKDLMAEKLPRIHSHLEQHNVDLSLFTFNWFLTVFVDTIPVDTYLRIWDVFLYEGSKVLFRYALAFFKLYENEILLMNDYMKINKFLRIMAENITDVKKLSHIAFSELNPFPMKAIATKRAQHMQIVKAQLEEFQTLRRSLPRNVEQVAKLADISDED